MASPRAGYSRLVQILKVVLPLLALGVLSTLFLFARPIEVGNVTARTGLPSLLSEQAINQPRYSTATQTGGTLTLEGSRARPDFENPGAFVVTDVRLVMQEPDGFGIELSAGLAEIPADREFARFSGDVTLRTNSQLVVTTSDISAAPDLSRVEINKPFSATTPFGSLEAGSLRIVGTKDTDGQTNFTALFQDGVKLIYTPSKN